MKRYLHLLLTLLLLSVCTVGGAQTTVTFTAGTDKSSSTSITKDKITITITDGDLNRSDNYRIYKGKKITVTSKAGNITNVTFTCTTSNQYGPGCFTNADTGTYTYSDTKGTWTGDAASFTLTASTSQVRATKIEVTYTSSGTTTKQSAGLSYSQTTATAIIGESFTAPTLNNPNNLTVSYNSSDKSVATIDASGAVTIKASGTTKITAKSDETKNYYAGEASYTLTVNKKEDVSNLDFSKQGFSNQEKITTVTGTNFTATFALGTNSNSNKPTYYTSDNTVRMYTGNTLTISSEKTITKIEIAFSENYYSGFSLKSVSSGSYTNATTSDGIGTWTGKANSVAFISEKDRIKSITVTFASSDETTKTATTLAFADGDKTFTQGDTEGLTFTNAATLTPAVDGATITYSSSDENIATVDEKTGEVLVSTDKVGSATITATYAGDDTYEGSTASYKITVNLKLTGAGTEANPYTVADVIALNSANALPQDQVFVKGIITKIDEVSTQHKNATYNISDNSQATNQLKIYRGKNLNNTDFTAAADLSTGWTVTVKGVLTLYNNSTLEMTTGNYITSIVKPSEYTAATLTGFAQSGNDYYATFSSDKVTFFPESNDDMTFTTDVQTANAVGDMMELKTIATANATIDGKEVSGYFVPANTGVLIKASFDNASSITYYTVSGKDVDLLTDNMLYPATKKMSELNNCYFYKLAYDDYTAKKGLGFYWGAENGAAFTAKTNGAYLAVSKSTSAKSAFRFDGTTTGVNTINAKTTTNDVIYNIQGQRVGASYKGLVIVNGKKMIRK